MQKVIVIAEIMCLAIGASIAGLILAGVLLFAVTTLSHAHGTGRTCHSHGTYATHCH
jgi:hypothetical protein